MIVEEDGVGESEEIPVPKLYPCPLTGEFLKKGSMLVKDKCIFNSFMLYHGSIRGEHPGREGIALLERIRKLRYLHLGGGEQRICRSPKEIRKREEILTRFFCDTSANTQSGVSLRHGRMIHHNKNYLL
jgi:hypothetical protein